MGVSRAAEFFDERIINSDMGITDADSLWRWVEGGASVPLGGGGAEVPKGGHVVYRGQANSSYNFSSALYRLVASAASSGVFERLLIDAEVALLESMRSEGLGRLMTDGELMMVLQHHGIPTRLIDVSVEPLEALFFAVDSNDEVAGRLFIVDIHDSTTMDVKLPVSALPWLEMAKGPYRADGSWTTTVALIDELALDPRMRAQRGKFLVGGTNRKYGGRSMRLGGVDLPAEDFPNIVSIGINFVRQRRDARNASWPATGWNVKIDGAWKPEIRERLASLKDPITVDSMYPPVNEVKRLALNVLKRSVPA